MDPKDLINRKSPEQIEIEKNNLQITELLLTLYPNVFGSVNYDHESIKDTTVAVFGIHQMRYLTESDGEIAQIQNDSVLKNFVHERASQDIIFSKNGITLIKPLIEEGWRIWDHIGSTINELENLESFTLNNQGYYSKTYDFLDTNNERVIFEVVNYPKGFSNENLPEELNATNMHSFLRVSEVMQERKQDDYDYIEIDNLLRRAKEVEKENLETTINLLARYPMALKEITYNDGSSDGSLAAVLDGVRTKYLPLSTVTEAGIEDAQPIRNFIKRRNKEVIAFSKDGITVIKRLPDSEQTSLDYVLSALNELKFRDSFQGKPGYLSYKMEFLDIKAKKIAIEIINYPCGFFTEEEILPEELKATTIHSCLKTLQVHYVLSNIRDNFMNGIKQ